MSCERTCEALRRRPRDCVETLRMQRWQPPQKVRNGKPRVQKRVAGGNVLKLRRHALPKLRSMHRHSW